MARSNRTEIRLDSPKGLRNNFVPRFENRDRFGRFTEWIARNMGSLACRMALTVFCIVVIILNVRAPLGLQFDHAALSGDHHQRGYLLQDLLGRTFDLHGISVSGEVAQANSPAIQNSSSISNSLGDCCAPSPSAGLPGGAKNLSALHQISSNLR